MAGLRFKLAACVASAALACALLPTAASAAETPKPAVTTLTIAADAVKGITDRSYDHLFRGGDARQGVADLIATGAVRINGATVPVPTGNGTYSSDHFDINDGRALWENADSTWSWNVQVLFHGDNESYANAVVDFVNGVTLLRGIAYHLVLTGGVVTKLYTTVPDVAFANILKTGSKSTTFTIIGLGDNSTDKPNPSTIKFPNRNVTGHPTSQSMVLYWEDSNGWHLQRASSKTVTVDVVVPAPPAQIYGIVDGALITDSRLTLQYSNEWNRPTQPIRAMAWMGENHVRVTQWFVRPGITVGFSRADHAKSDLRLAIATARHALATVAVSPAGDGSDIPTNRMWVNVDYHAIFARAVADAQAALADRHATADAYEGALYRLAQAYGGQTGDFFSFRENHYYGSGNDYGRGPSFDTGYHGTGFWTFATSHFGTASS